jgi:ankyrin repeat protein
MVRWPKLGHTYKQAVYRQFLNLPKETVMLKVLSLFLGMTAALPAMAAPGDLCNAITGTSPSLAAVQAALAAGESVNTNCGTITAVAAAMGRTDTTTSDIALYLINQGADPNGLSAERTGSWGRSRRYLTNLTWAAARASNRTLQAFLDRKPDLNFAPYGRTALSWAISYSKWDNVNALIDAGSNLYATEYVVNNGVTTVNGSALSDLLSLTQTPPALLSRLLSTWDFSQDKLDLTGVYLARLLGNSVRTEQAVIYLVSKGADLRKLKETTVVENAMSYYSLYSPKSALAEDVKIADYFIAQGLDLTEQNNLALIRAVSNEAAWLVGKLLDHGVKANVLSDTSPVLHLAAERNDVDTARLLLAHGAPVDGVDTYNGSTALYQAAYSNNVDVMKELVAQGANVNATDKQGNSPLCVARYNDSKDAAQFLTSLGARLGRCSLNN